MTKSELIGQIAEVTGLPKTSVEETLAAFVNVATSGLKMGNDVELPKLGKFKKSTRAARKGRNPKTGEPIDIPAAEVPKFVASKTLKDALNA